MREFSREEIINHLKTSFQDGKKKLQDNMPAIERRVFSYARKMGVKPEDIEKYKDRIQEKIQKVREKK
ncbi:hypothetical protein [Desulfonatronospira sp.]|uniref:hypothetical protein n=1 Tax=Desulfonatronospira sp. TaxID=1962951 RepID=UPI0025C19A5B|nr:hypothetical protein [Desulfonatronospira sp.]